MRRNNTHLTMLVGLFGMLSVTICCSALYAAKTAAIEAWHPTHRVTNGVVTLWLDQSALELLHWQVAANPPIPFSEPQATFEVISTSRVQLGQQTTEAPLERLELDTLGILALDAPGYRVMLGRPRMTYTTEAGWQIIGTWGSNEKMRAGLTLLDTRVDFSATTQTLTIRGSIALTAESANRIGVLEAAWLPLGDVVIEVTMAPWSDTPQAFMEDKLLTKTAKTVETTTTSVGPDIIVADIQSISPPVRDSVLEINAYSIGTTSCNIGDTGAHWVSGTAQHPVIAQNMYRLKDSRFEQIGMSWVKHGFSASDGILCSGPMGCIPQGEMLGPGCSDPYSASQNGFQSNLGPRSDINATTGVFSFPFPDIAPITSPIDRRIQVHDADLDPSLNADALYFAESQYIMADEAAAGNQDNNASYRLLVPNFTLGDPPSFDFFFSALSGKRTEREKPAIQAWQDHDTDVTIINLDVPNDRRFIVGSKVTALGNNRWSYEYAIQNLNSDRSAQFFSVGRSAGSTVSNVGFHDIDHHSGSPFSTTDWTSSVSPVSVTWSTQTFSANPNANALRWGSLFNFRFEADACAVDGMAALGLFKPGAPGGINFTLPVPSAAMTLQSTSPADGTIDARQPSEVNGSNPSGWQVVDFVFDQISPCAALAASDFEVSVTGSATAPTIAAVTVPDSQTIRVELSEPIAVRQWTTITHTSTGATVTLGFLPGDVNGDRVSNTSDIIALVDALNGVGSPRPLSSTDLNRSGMANASDLTRLIDLLNGADALDVFLQAQLPSKP